MNFDGIKPTAPPPICQGKPAADCFVGLSDMSSAACFFKVVFLKAAA